jgi:hypothetical protein
MKPLKGVNERSNRDRMIIKPYKHKINSRQRDG